MLTGKLKLFRNSLPRKIGCLLRWSSLAGCRGLNDQVWRVYQKAAGIGGLGTHSLRHTYRTWLDSVGTPSASNKS